LPIGTAGMLQLSLIDPQSSMLIWPLVGAYILASTTALRIAARPLVASVSGID